MGAVRYFLALAVLLSHMGISVGDMNPGVVAVVVFYALAGHVVYMLMTKFQSASSLSGLLSFYKDRFWRIYPLYFIGLILAVFLWIHGANSHFISKPPNTLDWLSNLSVIPLNFFMFSGQDQFTLIPPAWSLGLEIQFYILAPFILKIDKKLRNLIFFSSFLLFLLAQYNLFNSDTYGYRLLPGTLFIFMLGMTCHQLTSRDRHLLLGFLALTGAGIFFFATYYGIVRPFVRETSLGLLLSVIVLSLHKQNFYILERGLGAKTLRHISKSMGSASYGLFILHFSVIWWVDLYYGNTFLFSPLGIISVIILTTLLALILNAFIEKPIWKRSRPRV